MALSPADFAAYSRATGTPYPEDSEERAALAPAVRDFRQSQLRQQESGPNLGALAGLAAAGLGILGLGLAAKRGFGAKAAGGGRKGGVTLTDLSVPDVRDVNVAKIADVPPSKTVSRSLVPTEAEAMAQYGRQLAETFPEPTALEMESLSAPSRTSKILARLGTAPQYRPDPKDINYARFGPVSPEVAAARREQATQDLLRFAQQRQEDAALVATQTIGALESGEDQITGRTMLGAQRNEDLDLAQVNSVARQTGSADLALSMTPDGVPADQVELLQPITAQELADQAKEEMIARRQSLESAGLQPGTVRFERALAQPFRTSSSQQITGTQPIEFSLPAGPIRRTVESVGAQEPLIEKSVLNIGPQAVVTSTAAGTAIRGSSPSYHEALPKQSLRQLYGTAEPLVPGAPDELALDLPGTARVRGVIPDVEPQFLSKQEIQYGVLDRPETPGPTGGSAGIGIYGVEPGYVPGAVSKTTGEYSEAASRKPSYVPGWLQKQQNKTGFESLTSTQLAAAASNAQAPRIQAALEKELTQREVSKRSLEASEIARRAIIEGRDPQAILRQRGFSV